MKKAFTLVCLITLITFTTSADSIPLKHGKQRIEVNYDPTLKMAERRQTRRWLDTVSKALLTVYGEWPQDRFTINIKVSASQYSPVPWGQVTRGKPPSVLLEINPDFSLRELTADWTAFHELSHLLIPYRGHGDIWFSEGLASYYQNIIQARTGLISENRLWQKIAAGFERGKRDRQWPQVNLAEVSDHAREYRSFMRTHWSGVHYWLSADVLLRQGSQNRTSLDSVLRKLKNCCSYQSMSAREIANNLDQLAEVDFFLSLFNKYRASYAMPDYKPSLSALGIIPEYNNKISLNPNAPLATIRKSIYQGHPK